MRSKSIELMNQIKEYAERFYIEEGRSPSTTEIGNEVGVSRGTAYRYLVEMAEKGMIEYDGNAIHRKYFSGTSVIKISDNVQPSSLLGDSEVFAVKHHPFEMIPHFNKRGEDGSKRPAAVMR